MPNRTFKDQIRNLSATDDYVAAYKIIQNIIEIFNNPSTEAERTALEAVEAERPAYWHTSNYHNAVASIFLDTANRDGLERAVEVVRAMDKPRAITAATIPFLFTTLVPLNKAGRDEVYNQFLRDEAAAR